MEREIEIRLKVTKTEQGEKRDRANLSGRIKGCLKGVCSQISETPTLELSSHSHSIQKKMKTFFFYAHGTLQALLDSPSVSVPRQTGDSCWDSHVYSQPGCHLHSSGVLQAQDPVGPGSLSFVAKILLGDLPAP